MRVREYLVAQLATVGLDPQVQQATDIGTRYPVAAQVQNVLARVGNLDAVRVLRQVADVSANSLSMTVYRALPNDTDLSEFPVLGQPALNFAFADS